MLDLVVTDRRIEKHATKDLDKGIFLAQSYMM